MHTALQITLFYMKRLNETESMVFDLLCVLCFQRQPFRFLFCSRLYMKVAHK